MVKAELDHLIVVGETLDAGVAHIEAALGIAMPPAVGRHAEMGTMNRLLSLGSEVYLEAIAVDPDAPPPGRPRWYGLDRVAGSPRLAYWAARVSDLDAALADAPVGSGRAMAFERGPYRWRFGVSDDGAVPWDGTAPVLLQWESAHPAPALPDLGCRLDGLEVRHPDMDRLASSHPWITEVSGADLTKGAAPGLVARIMTPGGVRALA
ncbi:MAG: VOC family protein [Pseudomonadota bacterium]